jgi:hypothetical protein
MNCGQELFDYIQSTDPATGTVSVGWIGGITTILQPGKCMMQLDMGGLMQSFKLPDDTYPIPNLPKTVLPTVKQLLPIAKLPIYLPYTIAITFTATDQDDIQWTAGTLTFANKQTQAISAGTLHLDNDNPYYLYCDLADGAPNVLKSTQTFGDSVGGENILICFAVKGADSSTKALIVVGTQGPKLFIDTLSSITGNFGLINAGEVRIGTGTLGSNFTGWRLWVQSTVGRMAGYANNVMQWYSDTDGKLYCGAGNVLMDVNGLTIKGAGMLNLKYSANPTYAATINVNSSGNLVLDAYGNIELNVDTYINGDLQVGGDLIYVDHIQGNAYDDVTFGLSAGDQFMPSTSATMGNGSSTNDWGWVYGYTVYYAYLEEYQKYNDIEVIKNIRAKKHTLPSGEIIDVIDMDSLPPEVKGKKHPAELAAIERYNSNLKNEQLKGNRLSEIPIVPKDFFSAGAVQGLTLGALKLAIEKIELLESKIKKLEDKS